MTDFTPTDLRPTLDKVSSLLKSTMLVSVQNAIKNNTPLFWEQDYIRGKVVNFTHPETPYKEENVVLLTYLFKTLPHYHKELGGMVTLVHDEFVEVQDEEKTLVVATLKQIEGLDKGYREDPMKTIHIKKGAKSGVVIGRGEKVFPSELLLQKTFSNGKENKDYNPDLFNKIEEVLKGIRKYPKKERDKIIRERLSPEERRFIKNVWGEKCDRVFSIDDIENLSPEGYKKLKEMGEVEVKTTPDTEKDREELANSIIKSMSSLLDVKMVVNAYTPAPCFIPERGSIEFPPLSSYLHSSSFYHDIFHELGHATGYALCKSDEERKKQYSGNKSSKEYAREELCAEFTSGLLTSYCFGHTLSDGRSVNYLSSWGERVANTDDKVLYSSFKTAMKRAELILYSYERTLPPEDRTLGEGTQKGMEETIKSTFSNVEDKSKEEEHGYGL